MCCARWHFVRTNYLIEKRNRIFLVSAMWWWSWCLPQPHSLHSTTTLTHSMYPHTTLKRQINIALNYWWSILMALLMVASELWSPSLAYLYCLQCACLTNMNMIELNTRTLIGWMMIDDHHTWWWMILEISMIWYNRQRKHQRLKMMLMATWFIITTTFSITDVRDNFVNK